MNGTINALRVPTAKAQRRVIVARSAAVLVAVCVMFRFRFTLARVELLRCGERHQQHLVLDEVADRTRHNKFARKF